jgi:glycosyltransferase involved in cell wall biosynthesis
MSPDAGPQGPASGDLDRRRLVSGTGPLGRLGAIVSAAIVPTAPRASAATSNRTPDRLRVARITLAGEPGSGSPRQAKGYGARMHVALLGTYPPTQCGIATFTADVESSLRSADVDVTVVPVVPAGAKPPASPAGGALHIDRDDAESYVRAARALERAGVDIVLVQHEFGIFGGEAGAHLIRFVDALRLPYAMTLHTVLPRFSADQATVVERLCWDAAAVTVFTESARRLLVEQELATAGRVRVLPHGAPAELYVDVDVAAARRLLGLPDEAPVMSTFGLLSPGKGIETGIHAMALLRSEHPDLRYVIAGRTHPEVARRDGERYRRCLEALADDQGVADRVVFIDRFLDLAELAALLGVSDVVCTPYRGEDQAVSGVLTFALAARCPIVSTRYRYACDVLADGAGVLVDFDDDEEFADAIHVLLDPEAGRVARAAARQASSCMRWPTVGLALRDVLAEAIRSATSRVLPVPPPMPYARAQRRTDRFVDRIGDRAVAQGGESRSCP